MLKNLASFAASRENPNINENESEKFSVDNPARLPLDNLDSDSSTNSISFDAIVALTSQSTGWQRDRLLAEFFVLLSKRWM